MGWINKLLERLGPLHTLSGIIISFIFGAIFFYKFIFAPTDLKVVVQNSEMVYPSSIGKLYEDVFAIIPEKNESLKIKAVTVYHFLLTTTEQKTIIIENIGEKTLRDVDFRHLNIDIVTGYSINSDFFNKDEENKLYDNLIFDSQRGTIHLKQLIDIPPKKTVTIKLWGSFKKSLLSNDILIKHSEGDAFFDKSYTVTGVKGYFISYIFEFLIILFVIFCVIYHFGLKNAIKNIRQKTT